jgi:hypothetical protein
MSRPKPTKPPIAAVIQCTPKAVRPDVAAQYLGVTPFRIEEWMREGLLEFVVPPGSDSRVILVKTLDDFITSLPRQKGALAGRGRNAPQ